MFSTPPLSKCLQCFLCMHYSDIGICMYFAKPFYTIGNRKRKNSESIKTCPCFFQFFSPPFLNNLVKNMKVCTFFPRHVFRRSHIYKSIIRHFCVLKPSSFCILYTIRIASTYTRVAYVYNMNFCLN